MTTDRPLKECISSNKNGLVIFGADSFDKFHTRNASIHSHCDRAISSRTLKRARSKKEGKIVEGIKLTILS